MATITIFQTKSLNEIPNAELTIKQINTHSVEIKNKYESAVIGELAGEAIEIILSKPVQTILSIAGILDLGNRVWELTKSIDKAGRICHVDKEFASALVLAKAIKKYKKMYPEEFNDLHPDNIKTIGIMDASPTSSKLSNICYKDFDDEGREVVYFMGVVIKRPNSRSLTLWYIIRADGKICSSWETQTFTDRLPVEYR